MSWRHLCTGAFAFALSFSIFVSSHASECKTLESLRKARNRSSLFNDPDIEPRPALAAFTDSDRFPIRLHHRESVSSERTNRLIQILEAAWDHQVLEMGFESPPSDGDRGGGSHYDVYLTSVLNQSAMTVAETATEEAGPDGLTSFIVIDEGTPVVEEGAVLEHEFQHALQFGMDSQASLFLFEASAVYMEVLSHPQVDNYQEVLMAYQSWPNAAFFTDGVQWQEQTSVFSYYEYGGALLMMYLDETYGDGDGRYIADLWRNAQNAIPGINEPDFIDAMGEQMIDLKDLPLDFIIWRSLVGIWAQDGDGPARGHEWSGDVHLNRMTIAEASLPITEFVFDLKSKLHKGGCLVFDAFASSENLTLFWEPTIVETQANFGRSLVNCSCAI